MTKLSKFEVLSESEVREIHDASVDILENCGVKLLSGKMLGLMKEKGLDVDEDKQTVRFSKSCIESCLSQVPEKIDVFNRNGVFAFTIGDGTPKIAAGHNAVFWLDSETGETRNSTVADVELFAKICDNLDVIDMIGIPVMPQDIPVPEASLLYGVRACVENSVKPIFFSTDSCEVNRACIEILRSSFSGDLKEKVYGITQLSPTSPLYWEEGVLDAFMDTADTGVPIAILPEPIAGMSAPYTLAGLLTMNNTECISGMIMLQLLNPGMNVLYANSWTTSDMRSGAALVGSTETTLCRIAAAQLAKFYKAPSHTTAPNSDNHAHDEQNAWEKTFSQMCAVGAGHDLIVNCGMFSTGMTCSHEQLLMDAEISAMAQRIGTGIKVDKETMALDLIKEIGPNGKTYLDEEHTMDWLYSDEYVPVDLAVRGSKVAWDNQGGKDTYALAREKVNEYRDIETQSLDEIKRDELAEIIASFSK